MNNKEVMVGLGAVVLVMAIAFGVGYRAGVVAP